MSGFSERLQFLLELDPTNAIAGMRRVGDAADKELGKTDNKLDKLGGTMQTAGLGMMAFAAVAGTALYSFAKASEEAEHAQVELRNSISNSPELAGESAEAFTELADAIQDKTAADGDQIVSAMAMLGTFHQTGQEIRDITPLVVDYARKFGVDMVTAATQVGKALDGNATSLQKVGINIDEAAYATDRFGAVYDALAENVGGFAEEEGATFAGSIARLKNELGDLQEGIGKGVVNALGGMLSGLTAVSDKMAEVSPANLEMAGSVATIGTAAVGAVGAISFLAGSAIKMRANFTNATGALNNFGRAAQFAGIAAAAAVVVAGLKAIENQAKSMGEELGDSARQSLDARSSFADFTSGLESVNTGIEDLDDTLQGSQAPWDLDKREQIRQGMDALKGVRDEYTALEQEIRELSDTQGISLDQATRQVLSARAEAEARGELVAAIGEEEAATQELASAQEQAAESAAALAEESRGLLDETLALIDAELRLSEATRTTEEAVANYDTVVANAEATTNEIADAQDSAARAALNQAAAAAAATSANVVYTSEAHRAASETTLQRLALQEVANTLAPGSPLRAQLQGYINQLASIERDINTRITTTIETVYSSPNVPTGQQNVQRRASGGPVSAGQAYLVGEEGQETFVPGTDGTIVPNGGPGTPVSMGGGGLTANIYLSGRATRDDGEMIVDALNAWVRRNGPLPW